MDTQKQPKQHAGKTTELEQCDYCGILSGMAATLVATNTDMSNDQFKLVDRFLTSVIEIAFNHEDYSYARLQWIIESAKSELEFEPKASPEQLARAFVDWVEEERERHAHYDRLLQQASDTEED